MIFGISFIDVGTGRIIDDNIEKWDGHFKQKWGLGGIPTWTVKKNGKYGILDSHGNVARDNSFYLRELVLKKVLKLIL